jgi:predicted lipoprotein with Yx(FWY)xxD motif
MKRITFIVTLFAALTLLVTACAPAATPTTAPVTSVPVTQAPPPAAQASGTSSASGSGGAATVNLGSDSQFGSFLVDGKGMSLYLFTKDTPNTPTCYGSCAKTWPPLLSTGKPVAGTGVDMSKFGTVTRTDGTTQVTYNGWPLYYYAKDQQAGDTNGQGVGKVWYLISPTGDKVGG